MQNIAEQRRLASLRRLSILGSEPQERFDHLTRIARGDWLLRVKAQRLTDTVR